MLVVGHLCHDRIPGGFLPGGAAAYAGTLASRLGYHTALLTSCGPDYRFHHLFERLDVHSVHSDRTTEFENIYSGQDRIQYLHSRAAELRPADLPDHWRGSRTVLLGPICDEVDPALLEAFSNESFICVCPQGWMRRWDEQHRVFPKKFERWDSLVRADLVSLSEGDVNGDWQLLERLAVKFDRLVVTQGSAGATVFEHGRRRHFPACPAVERDPTGAGDIFAAAISLHYSRNRHLEAAVHHAQTAAAISIEGAGLSAVPDADAVHRRLMRSEAMTGKP
jgi:sugar/nucleoside kinase (ribokinase family)